MFNLNSLPSGLIFLTQGSNPGLLYLLHWQMGSSPLCHLGSTYETICMCQFSSVAQLCPTLCNPMNCSTPGLPVHHQLPEFTQTHGHRVSDANQPSHPLLSPSPPAFNLSLEKEMATHSNFLAWEIPWTEGPGRLLSMGLQRVRHN